MILLQPIFIFFLIIIQMFICGGCFNQVIKIWKKIPTQTSNVWLECFFALVVGFSFDICILFFLGISGFLTPLNAIILLSFLTGLFFCFNHFKLKIAFQKVDHILLFVLALFLIVIVFYSIHPTGRWDDTMYHLPEAKFYTQHHKIIFQPYLRYPLFPQNMSMIFSLAFMTGGSKMGGEILAQELATLPLFISGIGLIGVFGWLTKTPLLGVFAVTLLFTLKPIKYALGYAYIDNAAMMFVWSSFIAAALAFSSQDKKNANLSWIFLAGSLVGMGIGTKYFSGIMAVFLGIWLLFIKRNLMISVVYGIGILIFGTWWSIRSWIISGDPIHPFGGKIFGNFLWDFGDYQFQKWQMLNEGISKDLSLIFSSLTKEGLVQLFFFPICLLFWKKFSDGMKFFFFSCCSYLYVWYLIAPVPRFLAPILIFVVFFNVWLYWQIFLVIKHGFPALKNFAFRSPIYLNTFIVLLSITPMSYLLIKSQKKIIYSKWEQTLHNQRSYELMQYANKLIPQYGERMLGVDYQYGVYYYDGLLIGVDFGPGRTRQMTRCLPNKPQCEVISPSEMIKVMKEHDTKMLAVNSSLISIDVEEYQKLFELKAKTKEGFLFTLKNGRSQ